MANSPSDPILKKPITKEIKEAGGVAQGVGPEFKPQYHHSPPPKKKNSLETTRAILRSRVWKFGYIPSQGCDLLPWTIRDILVRCHVAAKL
jgi:hypothetical protein